MAGTTVLTGKELISQQSDITQFQSVASGKCEIYMQLLLTKRDACFGTLKGSFLSQLAVVVFVCLFFVCFFVVVVLFFLFFFPSFLLCNLIMQVKSIAEHSAMLLT